MLDSLAMPPVPFSPEYHKLASSYSTYRIGGEMETAWFPSSIAEAEALLKWLTPQLQAKQTTLHILGWGSNTLIASAGISGHTLITRKMANIQPLGDGLFLMEAGVHLAKAAHTVLESGLTLGEYMIGIPGTMGGATLMNAGAMGQETSRIVERVLVFDLEAGESQWLNADALAYAYRHSVLNPQKQVVLATECRFEAGNATETKSRMETNLAFRKAHHPTEPNGGSVFRNPPNAPSVGRMMDELGAKGAWQVGQAQVSALHGNFIVNLGGATSLDVLTLMRQMQIAAWEGYHARIFPENRFMGDATTAERELWQALTEGDSHHDN